MIEVNKRVYLNEQTLEITKGAVQLRKCLGTLYRLMLSYWEEL